MQKHGMTGAGDRDMHQPVLLVALCDIGDASWSISW